MGAFPQLEYLPKCVSVILSFSSLSYFPSYSSSYSLDYQIFRFPPFLCLPPRSPRLPALTKSDFPPPLASNEIESSRSEPGRDFSLLHRWLAACLSSSILSLFSRRLCASSVPARLSLLCTASNWKGISPGKPNGIHKWFLFACWSHYERRSGSTSASLGTPSVLGQKCDCKQGFESRLLVERFKWIDFSTNRSDERLTVNKLCGQYLNELMILNRIIIIIL